MTLSDPTYELRVKIEGMRCASCLNHIDNALTKAGALKSDINIGRGFGKVWYKGYPEMDEHFIEAIKDAGYEPTKLSTEALETFET